LLNKLVQNKQYKKECHPDHCQDDILFSGNFHYRFISVFKPVIAKLDKNISVLTQKL